MYKKGHHLKADKGLRKFRVKVKNEDMKEIGADEFNVHKKKKKNDSF